MTIFNNAVITQLITIIIMTISNNVTITQFNNDNYHDNI